MIDFFKITPKKRSVKIGKKYGVLYSNPSKIKKIIFYIGSITILICIGYLGYLYQPLAQSLIVYKFTPKNKIIIDNQEENNQIIDDGFFIIIPKISAKSDIVANVSPYNKEEYLEVLNKDKVAQSKTSSLPGMGLNNTTYIFAHSTQQSLNVVRKNSVFYLLDKLVTDDLIYIKYKGNFYKYKVYDKKVISYKEAEYLNYKDETKEVLILQTCWPIGTNWKRLLVFAERI
ncbi:MAG: sortase [Candidatus Shapirobacteria bacterium]|nr:sortase [Candidatus Shapirobacteria bacterium]